MSTIGNLSIDQLKRAIPIHEKIDSLQVKLTEILEGGILEPHTGKRKMFAAGRAKIAAAQRLRWAKAKGIAVKPKRKMSAAGRAAISAAAKARWKKLKAAARKRH